MELFHLFARLSLDRQRFEADVKAAQQTGEQAAHQVGSAWQRAGQTIEDSLGRARPASNALLISISGLAAGFTAAAVASVKFQGELEQATIGFETMLGSAERARQFLDDLADFAARTPFEFGGLVTASQRLLAMGFAAEQVIPTMRAVGDAVAALGAGQEGIDRVTRALGQMLARGKVAAEEMLQLTEVGIPAWELLAETIGVSVAEAMDLVSKGAVDARRAVEALVAGMEARFGGMMERQSRSFLGLWSNILDTLRIRGSEAFQGLFDAARRWMERLAAFVESSRFEEAMDRLGQAVDRFVAAAERAIERAAPFGRWLAEHADIVVPALTGAIALGLTPALYGLATAFVATVGPIAPFLATGAALGTLLALLVRRFGEASDAQEQWRRQAERNLRALDEQARAIQAELDQLDRLLPVVEDLGRRQNRSAEETRQLEAALKALQERYPWVRSEIDSTGDAFDQQIQALSRYREHLRGTLRDIVEAKELIARLTLPQLERELARAQQELAAAREEAARLVQLQGVTDPFRMAEILRAAGVEIDKSKGLFGTFSDYVQRQSQASAERLETLRRRVEELTAQINELKQAQQDAVTFRLTGQLPSLDQIATTRPVGAGVTAGADLRGAGPAAVATDPGWRAAQARLEAAAASQERLARARAADAARYAEQGIYWARRSAEEFIRSEEEKTRNARLAWELRYQAMVEYYRRGDRELEGLERLQAERGRRADAQRLAAYAEYWQETGRLAGDGNRTLSRLEQLQLERARRAYADRHAALAEYYAKADERAQEAARRQQEYEEALFRWRKAIGDVTLEEELERDRKRLESLRLTSTEGMMALETFYETWSRRITDLTDEERQALRDQLEAWLEVYGEDSEIGRTVEALLDRIAARTEQTTDRMKAAFQDFGETVAREMESRFGQWVDALTGGLSQTRDLIGSIKAAFLDFTKWFVSEVIRRILVASGVLEVAAAAAQAIAAALMSWNPFAIAAAVAAGIALVAWINSQLAALGASGGGTGGGPGGGGSGGGGGADGETGGGVQVAQLTGPDRDFFASLLAPLVALQVLQGTGERIYGAQVVTNEILNRIYGAIAGVDAASPDLAGIGAGAEATVAAIREQGSILHADLRELIDVVRGPLAVYPAPGSPPFPVALEGALRTGTMPLDTLMAQALRSGLRGVGFGR